MLMHMVIWAVTQSVSWSYVLRDFSATSEPYANHLSQSIHLERPTTLRELNQLFHDNSQEWNDPSPQFEPKSPSEEQYQWNNQWNGQYEANRPLLQYYWNPVAQYESNGPLPSEINALIPGFVQSVEEAGPDSAENEVIDAEEGDERLTEIPLGIPDDEKNVPGEPLTPQDFANAKNIELLVPVMDENSPDPIQSAGLFEGDIAGVNISDFLNPTRNAIKNLNQRWDDGVVPYAISAAFTVYERSVIAAAFQDYQDKTCIRFVPRTTQRDHVYLLKGSGCSSLVGRSGAGQQISLGPGCIYKGVIIHELMHALGFWHEQSRPDRDDYVIVLWKNIIGGMEYNFNKYSWDMLQSLGVKYDTSSVMHYTSMSFSKDGRSPTIVPRKPGVQFIGQRIGFSDSDVTKINRLYKCKGGGITIKPTKPTTTTKPPPERRCMDNHKLCNYWSGIGECGKNPSWMLVNCKKSCKQCPEECKDYNKDCEFWAGIGECKKNPSYMTIYCARSCKTCHGMKEKEECVDSNENCMIWAADSQCVVNPSYMLRYCRRACLQC